MPTIEARIMKVEQDVSTGWYRIATDHGSVKRLDTKHEDKAREANALKREGTVAIIQYTSRPRTLEDGRTFQNYYYDSAVAGAEGLDGGGEIEKVSTPMRRTDPSDAWRICLGAGAKLAVATLPLLMDQPERDRTFEAQQRLALAWALWIYTTPVPQRESAQITPSPGAPQVYDEPGLDFGAPPPDDIPY